MYIMVSTVKYIGIDSRFIDLSIICHSWWYFSHNLDMVEIEKCQLRDTRLNVQSPFALPRISIANFGIFKDLIIIFMIALSIDNQWTVE